MGRTLTGLSIMMYTEAVKIDFDTAIIGCGAYGFPLAAKLKAAGKQAFHMGGATQLLFGIKGSRWALILRVFKYFLCSSEMRKLSQAF